MRQGDQHFLRADLQEIHPLRLPIRQDPRGQAAARLGGMGFDQGFQLGFPMGMALRSGDKLSPIPI